MKRILLVCSVLLCSLHLVAQEWKVNVGDKTPSFVVTTKDGKEISAKSLEGKVVLINFFATWCPPCRAELPRLQKEVWDRWKANDNFYVMVLAREEGWDKIDPFVASHSYTFPVFPDLGRKVFGLFAEQSIPRNVLLNAKGEIIYQSIGYTADEFTALIQLIDKELKK